MKKPVVTIVTASKLTPAQKKQVQASIEKKLGPSTIEEQLDSSLMGGLQIKIGEQVFDASLAGKLERMESQLPEVTVTTAVELTDQQRKKVTDSVQQKLGAVQITEVVDQNVIGGIKIVAGSQELDGTIKGKLTKLKQQLLQTV